MPNKYDDIENVIKDFLDYQLTYDGLSLIDHNNDDKQYLLLDSDIMDLDDDYFELLIDPEK